LTAWAILPYVSLSDFKVGRVTFHVFGALVMIAVLLGGAMIGRRAERLGFSRKIASRLYAWMIVCGFLGAHVGKVIEEGTWNDPLALLRVWSGMYSFGGIAGGVAGCAGVAWWYGVTRGELWRFLDIVAYCFPFAWIFGRLGCALVHDHPGIRTTSWLGVAFPEGRRFDLGLLEVLFTVGVAAVFVILDWRVRKASRRPGFYFAALFLLYGPFRIFLDTLHEQRPHGFWSPDTIFGIAGVATGIAAARLSRLEATPARVLHSPRSGV
jgi:phosphatidylglycerol:prolipoprotein diacylglycerol transferase